MKKLYLAGPISYLTKEEASGWREKTEKEMSGFFRCYNPMTEEEKARNKEGEKYSSGRDLKKTLIDSIFTRDMFWVKDSDVILADFTIVPPSLGGGTPFELGAAWALGKPIILVGPLENISVFTVLGSSVRYDTLEEAHSFLRSIA